MWVTERIVLVAHRDMDMQTLESKLKSYLETHLQNDPAHCMDHILRVVKLSRQLALAEGAQLDIVLPAAYLHDCVSLPKNHPERSKSSVLAAEKARGVLAGLGVDSALLPEIAHAIEAHSYSAQIAPQTLEAQVLQDADRLDALGAVGLVRCIQVGTTLGREMWASEDPFCTQRVPDDKQYTLDHFYVKLFKLPELMNTVSARSEALKRVAFLKDFVNALRNEMV